MTAYGLCGRSGHSTERHSFSIAENFTNLLTMNASAKALSALSALQILEMSRECRAGLRALLTEIRYWEGLARRLSYNAELVLKAQESRGGYEAAALGEVHVCADFNCRYASVQVRNLRQRLSEDWQFYRNLQRDSLMMYEACRKEAGLPVDAGAYAGRLQRAGDVLKQKKKS